MCEGADDRGWPPTGAPDLRQFLSEIPEEKATDSREGNQARLPEFQADLRHSTGHAAEAVSLDYG